MVKICKKHNINNFRIVIAIWPLIMFNFCCAQSGGGLGNYRSKTANVL